MADESEQIIIRRRRSDGEEDHHGGAWKIAFADFMTAMMAFFLVMWLINSTSKETKATIVQYFNPVQLVDSSPLKKGLHDPTEGGQGSSAQKSLTKKTSKPGHENAEKAVGRDAELQQEPLKTLDEIAGEETASAGAGRAAELASEMLADPFDRVEKGLLMPVTEETLRNSADETAKNESKKASDAPTTKKGQKDQQHKEQGAEAALSTAIFDALKKEALGAGSGPSVEVKRTGEGLVIDLTDNANFSMFDVGSMTPKPQLVRLLADLGTVIAKQKGEIEIAGHTDGRSYKSKSYDNWRLSADRANMIYYMLIRGGVPESRVTKISGYADRRLKDTKSPLSAVNRRIEILIRGDRS